VIAIVAIQLSWSVVGAVELLMFNSEEERTKLEEEGDEAKKGAPAHM
jgi:hypothetical protein